MARVEQTLHGYEDGHQLLAGSVELAPHAASTLLETSDLSGPDAPPGFDSYLTGYPLEGSSFYALARTWLAPEMPRPGCVWTHTLLVHNADLAQLAHPSCLLAHFRRPTTQNYAGYDERISIELKVQSGRLSAESKVHARLVGNALYTVPTKTIVVGSSSAVDFEAALLWLWEQQWPRLRRGFRFCTGSLAAEDVGRASPDIEIVPASIAAAVPRRKSLHFHASDRNLAPDWTWAFEVLNGSSQEGVNLRQFLRQYGPDFAAGRSAFLPLVRCYRARQERFESVDAVVALVKQIARELPGPLSSGRLVADLLSPTSDYRIEATEEVLTRSLLTSPELNKIPIKQLPVAACAARLVETSPGAAGDILAGAPPTTELAASVHVALAGSTRPEHLSSLSGDATVAAAKLAPKILTWKDLWSRPERARAPLVEIARREISRGRVEIGLVLEAALAAEPPLRATEHFSDSLAPFWEVVGRATSTLRIDHSWISALAHQRRTLISLIEKSESLSQLWVAASAMAQALPPRGLLVFEYWHPGQIDDNNLPALDERDGLAAATFLLSVALGSSDASAAGVIGLTFHRVFDATAAGRHYSPAWRYLSEHLPRFWNWWDHCERLIRAVASWFVTCDGLAQDFASTFRTDETFVRAVRFLQGEVYGRSYLDSVAAELGRIVPRHVDVLHKQGE